jgi:hypothetical protein
LGGHLHTLTVPDTYVLASEYMGGRIKRHGIYNNDVANSSADRASQFLHLLIGGATALSTTRRPLT